jgi:hypothetical protein
LASSKFPPIERLYVLVNTIPITTGKYASSPTDDNLHLVPLTENCLRELLLAYLQKPISTMTSNEELYAHEPNSSLFGSPNLCSSIDLLPDHAREQNIRELPYFRHRYALIHGSSIASQSAVKGPARYYLVQLSSAKESGSPRRQQIATAGNMMQDWFSKYLL